MIGGPSSSAWRGGVLSGTGCMVPQSFVAEGNRPYLKFWVVTDEPWNLGYHTLTRCVGIYSPHCKY
jgi:hypothetical protein